MLRNTRPTPRTSRGLRRSVIAITAVGALAACTQSGASGDPQSQDGDDAFEFPGEVTVLTPWSAGGPSDLTARAFADCVAQYLPGEPNLVIRNMEGAGGLVGSNWAATAAPKDGTLITVTSGEVHRDLLDVPEMEYSLADVEMVAVLQEPNVFYASSASGVEDGADLFEQSEAPSAGGFAGVDSKTLFILAMNQAVGEDVVTMVFGYPGSAEVRQAVRQGELDINAETLSGWYGGVETDIGTAFTGLMETGVPSTDESAVGGFVRDERIAEYDLPTVFELVEEQRGEEVWDTTEGKALQLMAAATTPIRTIHLPPDTDPAAAEAWRTAVDEMFTDDAGKTCMDEAQGYELSPVVGDDAVQLIESMTDLGAESPEAIQSLKDLIIPE